MSVKVVQQCDRCDAVREIESVNSKRNNGWREAEDARGHKFTLCAACTHALTWWIEQGA